MNAALALSYREAVLPWTTGTPDDARFKRITQRVVGATLLLCLLFPWLPRVDTPPPLAVPEAPTRIAKLVLPPAPPKAEAPKPPPPPPVTRTAEVAEPRVDAKPKPTPRSVAEARNPVPNKPPGESLEKARRVAAGVGLLAMKDQIAQISGAPVAVQLNADIKPGPGIGTGSGPGVGAGTEPGIPTRAMITSKATAGSGGIATGAYSRDTGGGGLAGRATTLVEGTIGGGGGGGPGGGIGGGSAARGDGVGGGAVAAKSGGSLTKSGSGRASRSIEEIRLVFERYKGSIYALYNRALREDPSLQGKVVLELKILPNGEVSNVRVLSSELRAAELEGKLLARVRSFDFGAKDVETMVVSWPVDFLPS